MTTRYLVCGRRSDGDWPMVKRALAALILHPKHAVIIHGDARAPVGKGQSFDRLAGQWGSENGATVHKVPADWAGNGIAAGPIRNAKMLTDFNPDVVIAFPGGPGTKNMIEQATRAKPRPVVVQVIA